MRLQIYLLGFIFFITQLAYINKAVSGTPPLAIGGHFSLIDHTGHPYTDQHLKGRYALIYFGYTLCPTVCPTALLHITNALKMLPQAQRQRIQAIFITLDPAEDTPVQISKFLQNFDPHIIGLTGSPTALKETQEKFKVYAQELKNPAFEKIQHSSLIYLMDPYGHFVTAFSHTMDEKEMGVALQKILTQKI